MPLLTKYKNNPIIVLNPCVKPPYVSFSFGISKARVIIDKIFDIEKWYNDPKSKPMLNISPVINKSGKPFIIDRYKASLILEHKASIAEFIQRCETDYQATLAKEREKVSNFYPGTRRR